MKKFLMFCAALSLLNVFFTPRVFAFSVSYDQKVSVQDNAVATIKVVVKDEKMKAESDFGGIATVMLRNETGTYSYLPAQKMATKIPASMDRPNLTRDLPRFLDFLQENKAEKVGAEQLLGYDCDVYKFIEPTIQKEAKAWVWREKSFPVKIEVTAPEGLTTVELTNIQFDPQIDEAVFQVPTDAKVLDLEAAAQQAPVQAAAEGGLPEAPAADAAAPTPAVPETAPAAPAEVPAVQ